MVPEFSSVLAEDLGVDCRVLARLEFHQSHAGWHAHVVWQDARNFFRCDQCLQRRTVSDDPRVLPPRDPSASPGRGPGPLECRAAADRASSLGLGPAPRAEASSITSLAEASRPDAILRRTSSSRSRARVASLDMAPFYQAHVLRHRAWQQDSTSRDLPHAFRDSPATA